MLDALRHLALIVEHGTFREAARHAHLTQPALTAAIQRLEADIGTPLLVRGRRGAQPTPAGTALLAHAHRALADLTRGRAAALEAAGIEAGTVRLAAGATVSTYVLPGIVARFRVAEPRVTLSLRELPSDDAERAFEQHEVDLAIVSGKSGRAWLADELVLVASAKTRADAPMLAFPRGAGSRDIVDRYFPERPVVMELGSVAALLAHARAGAGVALVSRFALADDMRGLSVLPDRRTPVRRRLRILHARPKSMPRAARELLAELVRHGG